MRALYTAYVGAKITARMAREIRDAVDEGHFRNISDFLRHAIRMELDNLRDRAWRQRTVAQQRPNTNH